jgi:hypothetical protein
LLQASLAAAYINLPGSLARRAGLGPAAQKGQTYPDSDSPLERAAMSTKSSGLRLGLCAAALVLLPLSGAVAAGDVAGRYSVLRDDKDTGCMLTLMGGGRAQLAPACRDNGVVVFDPVKWTLDRGLLALTARKGHKAHFEKDSAGVWRRDAKEDAKRSLGFKPIP